MVEVFEQFFLGKISKIPLTHSIKPFGEGTTPEACDAFLAAETTKWGKVIRDAGVTLN